MVVTNPGTGSTYDVSSHITAPSSFTSWTMRFSADFGLLPDGWIEFVRLSSVAGDFTDGSR